MGDFTIGTFRLIALLLILEMPAVAQALEPLRSSAEKLRLYPESVKRDQANKDVQDFKNQLRNWIEPQLNGIGSSQTTLASLQNSLNQRLREAGLILNDFPDQGRLGFLDDLKVSMYEKSPFLLIRGGAMVPACGFDEFFYLYRQEGSTWRRYLDYDGSDKPASLRILGMNLSAPDSNGNQLIFVASTENACMSRWHTMYFDLYRIGPPRSVALLKDERYASIDSSPYKLKLEPAEILVEFSGSSIDGGALERPSVLHYVIRGETSERIAPFALRPEDFAEEWLTRPWKEAVKWSDPAKLASLEAEHIRLNAKRLGGEFWLAQQCGNKTDWQVAFESYETKSDTYFLVRQEAPYDFKMLDINERRQSGCPGRGYAHSTHPSLFPPDR